MHGRRPPTRRSRADALRTPLPVRCYRRPGQYDEEDAMRRRLLLTLPLIAGGLVVASTPAGADHVHFRVVGNGQCVLLAPNGGEKYVHLPHAEEYPPNREHPLHVNVHLGRPGEVGQAYVAYTADGTLTADAQRLCGGQFLNR